MKLCSEMEMKGIKDPDSRKGIDCCLKCRLEVCELETVKNKGKLPGGKLYIRRQRIKHLAEKGLTKEEIARELGISARTVQRYLA